MPGTTLATWNTNFRSRPVTVRANVLQLIARCQVAVLTEARSEGVDQALETAGWDQDRTDGSSDRLVWDPALWRPVGPAGSVEVHGPGPGKYLPAREVAWTTLLHVGSYTRHLFFRSHVTPGYASTEPDVGWKAWRDRAARTHLLALAEQSARLIAYDGSRETDHHHLLGDLNAKPSREAEWWYPSRVLNSLWVPDRQAGLDYVMHSRESADRGLEVDRRWTEALGSEGIHPAHYKRVSFPRG